MHPPFIGPAFLIATAGLAAISTVPAGHACHRLPRLAAVFVPPLLGPALGLAAYVFGPRRLVHGPESVDGIMLPIGVALTSRFVAARQVSAAFLATALLAIPPDDKSWILIFLPALVFAPIFGSPLGRPIPARAGAAGRHGGVSPADDVRAGPDASGFLNAAVIVRIQKHVCRQSPHPAVSAFLDDFEMRHRGH